MCIRDRDEGDGTDDGETELEPHDDPSSLASTVREDGAGPLGFFPTGTPPVYRTTAGSFRNTAGDLPVVRHATIFGRESDPMVTSSTTCQHRLPELLAVPLHQPAGPPVVAFASAGRPATLQESAPFHGAGV